VESVRKAGARERMAKEGRIGWRDGRLKEVVENFLGATQDMREQILGG